VSIDWQKSGLKRKKTKSVAVASLRPLPTATSDFFDHHCKGGAPTFCVESLFPTSLVYALYLMNGRN